MVMNSIALVSFCTHLTFGLIRRLRRISRLCIHPNGCWHTSRSTISMDATFYSILPSEEFFFMEWTANYCLSSRNKIKPNFRCHYNCIWSLILNVFVILIHGNHLPFNLQGGHKQLFFTIFIKVSNRCN